MCTLFLRLATSSQHACKHPAAVNPGTKRMEVSGNTAHMHSVVMCVQTGARGRKLDSKQQNTLIRLVIILCFSRLRLSS